MIDWLVLIVIIQFDLKMFHNNIQILPERNY